MQYAPTPPNTKGKRIVKINAITQAQLIKLFSGFTYDAATGVVYGRSGRPVGVRYKVGYLVCSVRTETGVAREYAHRLAFALSGLPVPELIDHINGDKTDNRLANLRPSSKRLNAQNVADARSDSTTKVRGVYINKRTGRFVAEIRTVAGKKYLGSYTTIEAASAAYQKARQEHHAHAPK